MKFIKNFFIVLVSLFVMLATQPANVLAETTHTATDLEVGDYIASGDIIRSDVDFYVYDIFGRSDKTKEYTAIINYFVSEIYNYYELELRLIPAIHVTVNLDGVAQDSYDVPGNLPFVVNKETNTLTIGNYVNYTPTIDSGKFAKWTWETSNNPSYAGEQAYDEGYQGEAFMLNFVGANYNLIINCTTYAEQTLTSLSVTGSGTVEKGTTATYYIHLIDQNGYEIKDETKTITYSQVDSSGSEIGTPGSITYSDGYSFSITPNTAGDLYYKFSLDGIDNTFHITVEEPEGNSIIENNEWPWATDFDDDNENVTLQTGLIGNYHEVTYQWQESSTTNDDAAYTDITSANSVSYTTPDGTSKTWFRCKISYKVNDGDDFTVVYTKGVQVLNTIDMNIVSYDDMMSYVFVSNGKGAYTYNKDSGEFNVLGLWNGSWICTSYDPSWSIYMKKPGTTIDGTGHYDDSEGYDVWVFDSLDTGNNAVSPDSIDSIYARFSNYDNSNVIFDVKLNAGVYADAAIYSDVAMGNDTFFGNNADNAAVKANLNGSSLGNVQLFASPNFANATNNTCSFVLTPILKSIHNNSDLNNVSAFAIDAYGNGDGELSDYQCNDGQSNYDDPTEFNYKEALFYHQNLIFNYNKGWWSEIAEWYDYDPFVYQNVGGQRISIGMYDYDSVLAMSWSNVNEFSFMFGIGKAGEVPGVTFTDVESESEGGGSHHHYTEVPNTSAYIG